MNTLPQMDWGYGTPATLRQTYASDRSKIADTCHTDVEISEVKTITGQGLCFTPQDEKETPILYFHGGGWVAGSPQTHVTLCSWLAGLTRRRVVSVPYGLCPELRFPAQYHDAARALDEFLEDNDATLVAGDSAGGAMAFWAESGALHRDRVKGILSFYGAFGAIGTQSQSKYGDANEGLSERDLIGIYDRLGCKGGRGVAEAISCDGAPAFLVTAEDDTLSDDHALLAAQKPGRRMDEYVAVAQPHAFMQFASTSDEAKAAMLASADWMDDLCS